MDREEYQTTQEMIFMLARIVQSVQLSEFIAQARRAEEIGLFIDPTLWIHGHANLLAIIRLAEILENFKTVVIHELNMAKSVSE